MAQRIESIRTTAFRLLPEHFGTVHVYRPGERFLRVWEHLEDQWRRTGNTSDQSRLPYRGLATALRVLSGDFVALQRRVGDDRAFIISRRPIPLEDLASTIGAWEVYALGMMDEPVGRVLDDLDHAEIEVASHIQRREGLCPTI